MAKKRKKNPVLEKKWQEGYEAGRTAGVEQAINYFVVKIVNLKEIPGIGQKTIEKIVDHFGEEYIRKKVEEDKNI